MYIPDSVTPTILSLFSRGACVSDNEPILLYEFMEGGILQDALRRRSVTWNTRCGRV